MTSPQLSLTDAELVFQTRNDLIETTHHGIVVVLSPEGTTDLALGDMSQPFFARSALKPLQAIGTLKSGAPLRGAQVAIACGSHQGTFEQMRAVQDVLQGAGVDATALLCPTAYPADAHAHEQMVRADLAKTPLAHPCSGKHAGFLWACAAQLDRSVVDPDSRQWTMKDYCDPEHPLQRMIAEEIASFTGEPVGTSGIDGCGAPVAAVSALGLARAYSTLGTAIRNMDADARASTVATAMVDYPELIQAPGMPDTVLSEQLDAVVKSGAAGVLCVGLRSGASVVVKISDGATRAAYPVALWVLEATGHLPSEQVQQLLPQVARPVIGGVQDNAPREVGRWVPGADLEPLVGENA